MIPKNRFLCLDTETTDLEPGQIIQIAWQWWDSHDRVCPPPFAKRYAPTCPVAPSAARVNGYTPDGWGGEPLTRDDLGQWSESLNGATILGANIAFDLGFIRAEYARLGMQCPRWHYRAIDVQSMATPLLVLGEIPDTKLDTLRAYHGIAVGPVHDAARDVADTLAVFNRMLDRFCE